jgi:hypothetical protein
LYRWLLWNSTADPEHELIYAVARDITARKQAEEERERLGMYCKSIRDASRWLQRRTT